MSLSSKNIGSIRALLAHRTRSEIKQMLLDAGALASRILPIPVTNNMRSSEYHSTATLISLMFDTVYSDFEVEEADQILLDLLSILKNKGIDTTAVFVESSISNTNIKHTSSPGSSKKDKISLNVNRVALPKKTYQYNVFICHANEDKESGLPSVL